MNLIIYQHLLIGMLSDNHNGNDNDDNHKHHEQDKAYDDSFLEMLVVIETQDTERPETKEETRRYSSPKIAAVSLKEPLCPKSMFHLRYHLVSFWYSVIAVRLCSLWALSWLIFGLF